MPVIYLLTASPLSSIVLPSRSGGPPSRYPSPSSGQMRGFTWTFNSRCAQHRHHCRPGELLPHLLTLTPFNVSTVWGFNISKGGYFLLHRQTLASLFPLGSEMPCVARTFLSSVLFLEERKQSSDKPVHWFSCFLILLTFLSSLCLILFFLLVVYSSSSQTSQSSFSFVSTS